MTVIRKVIHEIVYTEDRFLHRQAGQPSLPSYKVGVSVLMFFSIELSSLHPANEDNVIKKFVLSFGR